MGGLYKARGKSAQAHSVLSEAERIIEELAEGIGDVALRTRFLTAPPIQQVVQLAHGNANAVPQDHAEPSGR